MTTGFDMDGFLEHIRERERIRCPHCNEVHDDDDEHEYVSMYGTCYADGPYECTCYSCEKTFFIAELVMREYTTGKTLEEARGY